MFHIIALRSDLPAPMKRHIRYRDHYREMEEHKDHLIDRLFEHYQHIHDHHVDVGKIHHHHIDTGLGKKSNFHHRSDGK